MKQVAPFLIAPECAASGCQHDGDQYTMIKCRSCGHWFCEEHIVTAAGSQSQRLARIPTVKLVDTGLQGLAYYLGCCTACRDAQPVRRPVDSSWLR
jgi:hypothetical protein